MTDFQHFGEPEPPAWAPSEACRRWLLFASVAVLADAGLSAANFGGALLGVNAGVVRGASWLAVLPQLVVLWGLLTLARDVRDRGLWKSSAGTIGVMILSLAIELAADEGLRRGPRVLALIATAIGMAVLFGIAVGDWPHFDGSGGGEKFTVPKPKGKGCLATAALPILLIVAKFFARGWRRVKFNLDTFLAIAGFCLVLLALVFVIWFAVAKLRLARKLGIAATFLGVFEICVLVAAAVGGGAFLTIAAPELAVGNDAKIEQLAESFIRGGELGAMAANVIWALLAAWLFLSVRTIGLRDWRFEFSPDGVRPWGSSEPRSDYQIRQEPPATM